MTKPAFETPDLTQSNIEKIGVLVGDNRGHRRRKEHP
jgi:hypothetical protein